MDFVQNVSVIMTAIILETGTVLNTPSSVTQEVIHLRDNLRQDFFAE